MNPNLKAAVAALTICVSTIVCAAATPSDLEQARKLYSATQFEKSLGVLEAIPAKTGAVYELIGRNQYMRGDFKSASEAFEKAAAAEPGNSQYMLWLGRALGRRAETSSIFTAGSYASKARQAFERAVQLGPQNIEALNDLFEYYLQAPGFLGGGFDKAAGLVTRIEKLDPADGHWAQARLAEKKKQWNSAEQHLKRAAELAPQQVGRLVDLAKFFAGQGRFQEADQSLAKAEQVSPGSPKLLFEKAEVYIESGRNLDQARELLKRYLSSTLTPDDPPRSEAEKLLRRIQG
jgi:Flp pilus assembly protein TadD